MRRGTRVTLFATCVIGCDQGEPTAPTAKRTIDPCSLVTQNDATAVFGHLAVKQAADRGECVWGYDFPDHSSWSLHVTIRDPASIKTPIIIVTKTEITYQQQLRAVVEDLDGKPAEKTPLQVEPAAVVNGEPVIAEPYPLGEHGIIFAGESHGVDIRWKHRDNLIGLALASMGPSAPKPTTKLEPMKRLAAQVEAALERAQHYGHYGMGVSTKPR